MDTYEKREAARTQIQALHKQLLANRLMEGRNMTSAIKLASDDLQIAIGNKEPSQNTVKQIKSSHSPGFS